MKKKKFTSTQTATCEMLLMLGWWFFDGTFVDFSQYLLAMYY